MHFLTSIFQQSWKNISMLSQWESLCKASDGCALRTYPALPCRHPHPWTRSYPMTSACSQGGMCNKSLARKALGSLRCQCFGHMKAAGSEAEQSQVSARGKGAGNGTNCSGFCQRLACHTFFFWTTDISDGWKWKCRSSALTSVCTNWVNTRWDTTQHNSRSNCWLQFAIVSSMKPFQHFTTHWLQLRR